MSPTKIVTSELKGKGSDITAVENKNTDNRTAVKVKIEKPCVKKKEITENIVKKKY